MVPHFDPHCPFCTEMRDVIADLDAIERGPVTHLRFRAYRRELFSRLKSHAIVRHDPHAISIPFAKGESEALDAEDRFTIALLTQIEGIAKRFSAAVAAEVETTA